jgi:methyl-accepting chemotaxis protein
MKMLYKFGLILLVFVAITVVTSVLFIVQTNQLFAGTNENSLNALGADITYDLNEVILKATGYGAMLSHSDELAASLVAYSESGSREELIAFAPGVFESLAEIDHIKDIEILDSSGVVLLRSNNRSDGFEKWGDDKSGKDYVSEVLKGNLVADIFFDISRGRFDIRCLRPLMVESAIIGAVSVNYAFDDQFSTVLKEKYGHEIMFFMVADDDKGALDLVGSTLETEIPWDGLSLPTYREPTYRNEVDLPGISGALYSMPISDSRGSVGAVIVIVSDNDLLYSMQRRLISLIAIIIVVSVAAIVAGSYFFIWRPLMKPIISFSRILPAIAEGDLTKELVVNSRDELATLSESVNTLLKSVATSIAEIKRAGFENQEVGDSLKDNCDVISHSVQRIGTSIDALNSKMGASREEIEGVFSSTSEINNSIEELNKKIERQIFAVTDSTAVVEEMMASITNLSQSVGDKRGLLVGLNDATEKGSVSMQQTVTSITEIDQLVENITRMVKIINGISAKTNLLAMNAAIEAAHAGDAGRGFAVVAGEIRGLAEATNSNAKEIANSSKVIAEKITETTGITQETSASMEQVIGGVGTVSDSMREMEESMREMSVGTSKVTESLAGLADISTEVKNLADEMRSKSQMIFDTMQIIQANSIENTGEIGQVADDIGGISASTTALRKASDTNRELTADMATRLKKFVTEV